MNPEFKGDVQARYLDLEDFSVEMEVKAMMLEDNTRECLDEEEERTKD